jgi:hypothetical protein
VTIVFLGLVVATEWFELLEIEERIVVKVAMLTVLARTAELGLELLGDPLAEAAKNSDEIGLVLWRR